MSKLRKRIILIGGLSHVAVLLISIAYTVLFLYSSSDGSPSVFDCSFKNSTLLYCPGCGGSRGLYYFLTFDWVRSFVYCPAILVTVGILAFLDLRVVRAFIKDSPEPIRTFPSKLFLIIPAVLLLNFIVRNVVLLCGIDYIGDIAAMLGAA